MKGTKAGLRKKVLLAAFLGLMVLIAFIPAAASAKTVQAQENPDKSFTIEMGEPFYGADIRIKDDDTVGAFELQENRDYTVEEDAGVITILPDFTTGKTGFYPKKMVYSLYLDYGDWLDTVKGVKSFNIKNVTITKKFTYDGKQKSVSIKGLKKGTDYKVTYKSSKRKNYGTYSYKIQAKGKYSGKVTGKFQIVPKQPVINVVKDTSSKVTVKWSRVRDCSGYQAQLVKDTFDIDDYPIIEVYKSKKLTKKTRTSVTFKSLDLKRFNEFRVRSYKKVKGKTYYSKWTVYKFDED